MKDGDTAERSAGPLGIVLFKLGIHGLQEGTDEGHLHGRPLDATLVEYVADWRTEVC
jgi:hypothetical protein